MKRLLVACSLLLSSALFASDSISTKTTDLEIEISSSHDKEVDHLSYNFGTLPTGSFRAVNYYLTNTGNQPLYFRNARLSGPGYFARHNCGGVLPQRGRCQFTIEFAPFYEGYYSGQFMMSFDSNYSVIVNLYGQAFRY